jgi:hypothetical protein
MTGPENYRDLCFSGDWTITLHDRATIRTADKGPETSADQNGPCK